MRDRIAVAKSDTISPSALCACCARHARSCSPLTEHQNTDVNPEASDTDHAVDPGAQEEASLASAAPREVLQETAPAPVASQEASQPGDVLEATHAPPAENADDGGTVRLPPEAQIDALFATVRGKHRLIKAQWRARWLTPTHRTPNAPPLGRTGGRRFSPARHTYDTPLWDHTRGEPGGIKKVCTHSIATLRPLCRSRCWGC